MTIEEKIASIKNRKKEIRQEARSCSNSDELRRLNMELDGLNDQLAELEEQRSQNIAGGNTPPLEQRQAATMNGLFPLASFTLARGQGSEQGISEQDMIQRGQSLKDRKSVEYGLGELSELRAITIGSGNVVVPTHTSNSLNPAFNEVSSLIDVVNSIPLPGGEAYKKGFVVEYGEGDYTTETGDYEDAEPSTDFVTIGKAKITAYAELSDESAKLPDAMYQDMVRKGMEIALRKKIARQIITGLGGENQIRGIFNAPANVIPTDSDLTISKIDETTLDKIVFGYGGSENVEGGAYLMLNKQDLAAFAAIRATDGKKLYTIKLDDNGNTGTISSDSSYAVRFIINSACASLSNADTAADTYCMAYGKPLAYELPLFSPMVVEESRDFKFKSGQICYRGSIWIGGNVAAYKGFVRVKKGAVSAG